MSTPPVTTAVRAQPLINNSAMPTHPIPPDVQQLVHDLRVHQVELEMQNEELRCTQVELESAEALYFDLYELAPVGYLTLDEQGLILQANLTAATLLGQARSVLLRQAFSRFVFPADQDSCYLRHQELLASRDTQSCELRMTRADGTACWVNLTARADECPKGTIVVRLTLADITPQKQADQTRQALHQNLTEAHQNLRAMAAQNEARREFERKHMAREVHDELGQVLTALRMNLSLVQLRFGALDADLVPQMETLKALADRALAGVRNVATHLRPSVLDLGLVPAIEWLCQEFVRTTGVNCTFHLPDPTLTLDEARAVVLWRIVQESLTNISRYAQASVVSVCFMQQGPDLWLHVRDNGCGFDVDVVSRKQSFGLLGMRERVLVLGGELTISSRPGKGTRIEVRIPQDLADAQDTP